MRDRPPWGWTRPWAASTHSVRLGYTNYDNTADPAGQNAPGVPETVDSRRAASDCDASSGPHPNWTHPNSTIRRYQDTHEMRYDAALSVGRHACAAASW